MIKRTNCNYCFGTQISSKNKLPIIVRANRNEALVNKPTQYTALVYIANVPLVGFEGLYSSLEKLQQNSVDKVGGGIHQQLALHELVVVQVDQRILALDFLPIDPTSPLTAARLLSGGSVPGILFFEKISSAVIIVLSICF